MNMSSISTAYGSTAATLSPTICMAPTEDQTDAAQLAVAPPPPRRHPMRDALLAGLEALGVVKPGASTDGTSQRTGVIDAVLNFTQALGEALRGDSSDAPSGDAGQGGIDRADRLERRELRHERRAERREDRVERREERRAERRDGDGTPAYGDVADRLEALATAIRAHTQTSDPAPSTPAISTTPSTAATEVTTEAKTGSTPLLDAFGNLLAALKSPGDSGSTLKDAAAQLADFLHQLAQRLAPSSDATSRVRAGLLIDVTA